MNEFTLNAIGLVLNIVGSITALFYGFPQPTFEEGISLGLSGNTPIFAGKTVDEHNAEVRRLKRRYLFISRLALALMVIGFALQLWANFITSHHAIK
jgi:hypothetical protein